MCITSFKIKSVRLEMNSYLSSGDIMKAPPSPIGKMTTPRTTAKSTSDDTFLQSPETPLFSREDQINIHKQKEQLELDISSLEKRKESLLAEIKRVKENKVSQCELFHLKADTQQKIAENYASKVTELMTNYAEIVRENKEKQTTIEVCEMRIAGEIERRNTILSEISQRQNALNLNDIPYKIPELKKANTEIDAQRTHLEIEKYLQQTQNSNKENNELILAKPSSNITNQAASEYAKSLETQWKLHAYGTTGIRAEIAFLQRLLSESDVAVKKLELERTAAEEKNASKMSELRKEETDISTHNLTANASFKAQIDEMDKEINQLKASIQDSANIYEGIQQEMDDISDKRRKLMIVDPRFDDNSSYSTNTETYDSLTDDGKDNDYYSDSSSRDSEKNQLLEKKARLTEEVAKSSEKYRLLKSNAILKREKKISEISTLFNKYKANKNELGGKSSMETISLDNILDDSSGFSKHIANIINKIDSSIIELRQDIQD